MILFTIDQMFSNLERQLNYQVRMRLFNIEHIYILVDNFK